MIVLSFSCYYSPEDPPLRGIEQLFGSQSVRVRGAFLSRIEGSICEPKLAFHFSTQCICYFLCLFALFQLLPHIQFFDRLSEILPVASPSLLFIVSSDFSLSMLTWPGVPGPLHFVNNSVYPSLPLSTLNCLNLTFDFFFSSSNLDPKRRSLFSIPDALNLGDLPKLFSLKPSKCDSSLFV